MVAMTSGRADVAFDVVVVGAGTAGCVLAARLSEEPGRRVALIEAGPDFGPAAGGGWPAEIAGDRWVAHETEFDWGYRAPLSGRPQPYLRGRVVGGSSAINALGINWGLRQDYDGWAARGLEGWDFEGLLPAFRRVERLVEDEGAGPIEPADAERGRDGALPVTRIDRGSPYLDAFAAACERAGLPLVDPAGPNAAVGYGAMTRNVVGGRRVHAAAAYLDPARDRPNLTILAETEVDRIEWAAGRARSLAARGPGGPLTIEADRIVLAGGAVGSPILLQRSGIGPAELLRRVLGPDAALHALPGVGRRLLDHFGVRFAFLASADARSRLEATGGPRRGSIAARLTSDRSLDAYDITVSAAQDLDGLLPVERVGGLGEDALIFPFIAWHVQPRSVGRVEIRSAEPAVPPLIDHGFGADEDIEALARGIEWGRERARDAALASWLGGELQPGAAVEGAALRDWVRDHLSFYFHAVGTCAMGPADEPDAVVDATGRVRGFENLYVADASVMPTIPRGMIHLSVYAVAEKLAALYAREG
jgi:choline dehydrogenase